MNNKTDENLKKQELEEPVSTEEIQEETDSENKDTLECDNAISEILENVNQPDETPQEECFRQFERKVQTIETKLQEDMIKIENLLQAGVITPQQRQNLAQYVLKKGYDSIRNCGLDMPESKEQHEADGFLNKKQAIIEFEKENPDFFNNEARLEVLNYVKTGSLDLDKEELVKISNLVESIEKSAIEKYLKQVSHEKQLNKINEQAKSRLASNAQKSNDKKSSLGAFTAEQIGKMSGAEFTKNEALIMEQLRKGLIR